MVKDRELMLSHTRLAVWWEFICESETLRPSYNSVHIWSELLYEASQQRQRRWNHVTFLYLIFIIPGPINIIPWPFLLLNEPWINPDYVWFTRPPEGVQIKLSIVMAVLLYRPQGNTIVTRVPRDFQPNRNMKVEQGKVRHVNQSHSVQTQIHPASLTTENNHTSEPTYIHPTSVPTVIHRTSVPIEKNDAKFTNKDGYLQLNPGGLLLARTVSTCIPWTHFYMCSWAVI